MGLVIMAILIIMPVMIRILKFLLGANAEEETI